MPTITFTSSGSWQSAATLIDCQCTGEGGKGSTALHNSNGLGGGGGEYAEETQLAVTLNQTYNFTIGGGGSSTNTSFPGDVVTVTAHYGQGGSAGGAGGSGSTNSIHYAGNSRSGSTGGTAAGPGGAGTGGAGGTVNNPGTAPGGGGGGGFAPLGPGKNGAAGQIVIIYTVDIAGTAALSGVGTLTAGWSVLSLTAPPGPSVPGRTWLRRYGYARQHMAQPGRQIQTFQGTAALTGVGTLTAFGAPPQPAVVNAWTNSYGSGTAWTSLTPALQSCVVPLTPAFSAGSGSGTPTAGNWLFTIATWTQSPQIANVHVGVSDDIHSWWRQYPAAGSAGNSRTSISYTPNIARIPGNVYVAPDGEVAAINVLVVEVFGLGPWDTVTGTGTNYAAASTSLGLSLGAPPQAAFFIAATGGDNVNSGQAFLPSGWMGLQTQTQSNGTNGLADNILTAAYLPSSLSAQSVTGTATTAENLSGFILGVEVTAASPIPAGHNPVWPYVIFEAAFGAGFNTPDSELTWTDITNRLWSYYETTGVQYELGQLQATELNLQLDNFDGALSPSNASSAYYPNVKPGTPVRLRAALGTMGGTVINRWYIFQRNATEWDEEITGAYRRYSPVRGSDLWAALSSVPPTSYRSEVYQDIPYAWWPMDDQPGTGNVLPVTLLNAARGNTNVLNILLSPSGGVAQSFYTKSGIALNNSTGFLNPPGLASYTVGADEGWMFGDPQSAVPTLQSGNPVTSEPGSAAWQALGQAGSTGSYGWFLSCNDAAFPPLSGGVTVEIWFNYQFYGSAKGSQTSSQGTYSTYLQQPYNTPFTIWELATPSAPVCVLQLDTSGHLNLITYNGASGTSNSIYTASDLRSNSWHMVTVTLTPTSWTAWLDGGANAQVSGTAAGMTSAWSWLIVNGDMGGGGGGNTAGLVHGGNGAFAHLAVYPFILPYYRIMDHYLAAVSAFGQLPAPTGVGLTVFGANGSTYAPDGQPPVPQVIGGGYSSNIGNSASAEIAAVLPGGVTSGPSAWATGVGANGVDSQGHPNPECIWVTWTGVAPSYLVYLSPNVGGDQESSVVNGSGDLFISGFGTAAQADGVCHVSGGDGSPPPAAASVLGDTVAQRIERLMGAGRCISPKRSIDPAPLLVQAPGSQGGGTQVGAAIQAIQQSDGGMLFTDNCGNLTYWQRPHLAGQYSSPAWQVGPTSPKVPYYKEIQWLTDPQRIWNAITIAPFSPTGAQLPLVTPQNASGVLASQVQYGAQPFQVTSWLQSRAEMQAQANWLFANYGQGVRRAERVRVEAASNPNAWLLVLGINVGDVVQLEDWVVGGGGAVGTYRVSQIRRHVSYGSLQENVTASVELVLDYEPASWWV